MIVWLGGHAYHWEDTKEFNMYQDVAAARVVFVCGAPLVQLPCMGVVSHFVTTGPELEAHLRGKNSLCDYLVDLTTSESLFYGGNDCWSRIVWDVSSSVIPRGPASHQKCPLCRPRQAVFRPVRQTGRQLNKRK